MLMTCTELELFQFAQDMEMPDEVYCDLLEDLEIDRHLGETKTWYFKGIEQFVEDAPSLARVWRVSEIVIEDRRPYACDGESTQFIWATYSGPRDVHDHEDRSVIPDVFLRYMEGSIIRGTVQKDDDIHYNDSRYFDSIDEADDTLQDAMLKWSRDKARQLMGLHIVC